MGKDLMRYDLMAQEALRGVVREALRRVAEQGSLPGDHHFYVSFRTQAPGVELAPYLRDRYPNEMTIVLEHQFWDLKVEEHQFSVGLSFSQVPETLLVPFEAVSRFYDPSVQFGLQFDLQEDGTVETKTPPTETPRALPNAGPSAGARLIQDGQDDADAKEPGAKVVS